MMYGRSGRPISQRLEELQEFIDLLVENEVRSYLEIGARHGDTFFSVVKALPRNSLAVAVDLPGGNWGTRSSVHSLYTAARELRELGYRAHVLLGDSTVAETINSVASLAPYDACLIDGDHLYEGVKTDWLNYGPMAKIVAFHDIDGEGFTSKDGSLPVEVPKLWAEIKEAHRHREIIHPPHGMGIGVVWR